jgi:hypothetical protein
LVERFYFGCESDDPVMPSAFEDVRKPGVVRLHAIFGSDTGSLDVPLMEEALGEVCEPLEEGILDGTDLRVFVFGDRVRLSTSTRSGTTRDVRLSRAPAEQSYRPRDAT